LISGASIIGGARPAAANTQKEFHVGRNASVTRTYQAPTGGVGLGLAGQEVLGYHKADCEDGAEPTASICDYIPVKLDVTDKDLASGRFALAFTLSWPTTNIVVPGFAAFAQDGLAMTIWDDPEVEDDDAPPDCGESEALIDLNWAVCQVLGPAGGDPGGDESYVNAFMVEQPIRFGMIPKKLAYAVIVENDYGFVPEYTLNVSLVAPDNLVDLSVETPVDLSAATPSGPVQQSFGVDTSTGEIPPTSLDLAGLGAADLSPDRDFSGLDLNQLDLSRNDIVRNAARQGLRAPGKENAAFLWLWLVILPIAILGGAGAWLARRRTSAFVV
jgi:hypothetical protein